MDFWQTNGGQSFACVLKSALPRIAENLGRIADAMEKQNEQQLTVQTVQAPVNMELLARAVAKDLNPMPTANDIRQTQLEADNG